MQRFNRSLIGIIHKIDQLYAIILHRDTYERNRRRHELHHPWQRRVAQFNPSDYLVKFKVAHEQLVARLDEAQVECQVVVSENTLAFVFWINLVKDEVSLCH